MQGASGAPSWRRRLLSSVPRLTNWVPSLFFLPVTLEAHRVIHYLDRRRRHAPPRTHSEARAKTSGVLTSSLLSSPQPRASFVCCFAKRESFVFRSSFWCQQYPRRDSSSRSCGREEKRKTRLLTPLRALALLFVLRRYEKQRTPATAVVVQGEISPLAPRAPKKAGLPTWESGVFRQRRPDAATFLDGALS